MKLSQRKRFELYKLESSKGEVKVCKRRYCVNATLPFNRLTRADTKAVE